jgi:hypothetical protein
VRVRVQVGVRVRLRVRVPKLDRVDDTAFCFPKTGTRSFRFASTSC